MEDQKHVYYGMLSINQKRFFFIINYGWHLNMPFQF